MSGSFNQVLIIGNLGADPEVRTFANGGKVCSLRVATSEKWRDKNTGENKEITHWHSVSIYDDRLADLAARYLAKGKKVLLRGKLETRKWQDQSGQDRYTTEVVLRPYGGELVFLDPPKQGGAYVPPSGQATHDDEIPF